jgi:hypothetical protein
VKAGRLTAGESRPCPHCKGTILKSAATCPICRHNLRFAAVGTSPRYQATACPLTVEGTIKNGAGQTVLEYFLLMEVRDETGKVISRQSLGVGAIAQAESRTFSLRVETAEAEA